MMTPSHGATHAHSTPSYKPAYTSNPVYKDEFGTRSSSGVSTDPDNNSGPKSGYFQNTSAHPGLTSGDQPIYHFIDAPPSAVAQNSNHQNSNMATHQKPPTHQSAPPQNYNYNSNYPTYAYPNPYQPR